MTLVIGLDTGGTYTDAALLDATGGHVLATGKALTTRDDLSIGLGEAIATVLQSYDGPASDIGMVSLSTTLATNAVVEGVGGRVGLFMIGFDDKALERADLARAIGQDPVQFVAGGHRADGGVQEPFDSATLTHAAASMAADVSAFAVAGHFATRNPAHETAARDILRETTGLPVTCSHELSSALGTKTRLDRGFKCAADQSFGTAGDRHRNHHETTGIDLSIDGGEGGWVIARVWFCPHPPG